MQTPLFSVPARPQSPWRHALLGLPLAVLLAFTPLHAHAQGAPVPTVTVQYKAAGASYTLDGTVQAVRQSTVSAQASGRIATLVVKAGDKVRAGQLIATIDDREAQVGVTRSQAQVQQAEAELRNAQAQLERTRDLQKQGFLSKAALDTAETQHKAAVAQRDQAVAGARQSDISQGFTRVTAPFDGWVLQTHAEAGDLAVPGKPLATVYAPQPLRAVVQVPASRSAVVRDAKQTTLLVQTGQDNVQSITPVIRSEIPSSDPVSQTSEWRMELPAKDAAGLVPGQQIRAQFALAQGGSAQKLLVPAQAIVRRGELTAVYVASNNAFVMRAIRLGSVQSDGIEVLSGLAAGEAVALDPLRASNAGAPKASK